MHKKLMFTTHNASWILQQDVDPEHRSLVSTAWKAGIHVLDWPFQSPDANQIKNIWLWMKLKLRKRKIKLALLTKNESRSHYDDL